MHAPLLPTLVLTSFLLMSVLEVAASACFFKH